MGGWGEDRGPTAHETAQERLRRAARAHVDADSADTLRALQRAVEDVERDGVVGNSLVGVPSRAGGYVVDQVADDTTSRDPMAGSDQPVPTQAHRGPVQFPSMCCDPRCHETGPRHLHAPSSGPPGLY